MEISTNIVDDINRHHGIAFTQAKVALQHAKAVGKLLLEVRDSLPTGQLGDWLNANVSVPLKQAQHYMAAAEGTPVPIRLLGAECDAQAPVTRSSRKWEYKLPSFIPQIGLSYLHSLGAHFYYLIEPSKKSPGFHFVSSCLDDGTEDIFFLRRPIRADAVEFLLEKMNLKDPAMAEWRLKPSEGVDYAGQSLGATPPEKEEWQK